MRIYFLFLTICLWDESAHTRGVNGSGTVKAGTLLVCQNSQLLWDHTPPPILIGHLLRPHNSFPYFHWLVHAHSLYALCMFQGSYPWCNCHEFINRFHAHSLYPRSRWPPPGVLIFPDVFQTRASCVFLWPCSKIGTGCIFQNTCPLSFGDLFSDGKYYRARLLYYTYKIALQNLHSFHRKTTEKVTYLKIYVNWQHSIIFIINHWDVQLTFCNNSLNTHHVSKILSLQASRCHMFVTKTIKRLNIDKYFHIILKILLNELINKFKNNRHV